jgi:hypothetical protein
MTRFPLLCLLFLFLVHTSASSQARADSAQSTITAVRIGRPLTLSGTLEDSAWSRATPIELPYEFQPGENTPAPVRTQAYALYDDEHLYLGFRCLDPRPADIRANLSDRDKIFSDDYIIVVIDTYGDYQRGYELAVNPYGVQGDLMMSGGGNEDESFDMIWETKASINDEGWTAEMAIPFKSIRFPVKDEHTWGFIVARNYPRESRVIISWTPVDRNKPSLITQGGLLKGLRGIHSGGAVEVLPYVLGQQAGSRSDDSDPASEFENGPLRGRVGAGFRYAPSSNLALDLVVNPDFSQVESDADQISVNTTFALYYPEKRPFFLESSELLRTPMYYSRSINDPLAAGRVVGKTGSLTYLYLGALDRNTVFVVPGEEQSNTVLTGMNSFANIARLRYNFEDETYIGGMAFTRNLNGSHNYVAGFDWNYKFWTNWYFKGEGFLSSTKELSDSTLLTSQRVFGLSGRNAALNGEEYSGSGIDIVLSHVGRDYGFDAVYDDFSPTYQSYDGLFATVNYREFGLYQRYTRYWDDSFLEKVNLNLSFQTTYNHGGTHKEVLVQPGIYVVMKGQTNVSVSYLLVNDELFRGTQFRNIRRAFFNLDSRTWDSFAFSLYGQVGLFIYRSSAPETGEGHSLGGSVTVKPTAHLKVDLSYDRARLRSKATGSLLYDGYVARSVAIYQFTPEMFVRAILQYNSFGKTFNVYPLFSYKVNALTTFYAGFTNDYRNYGAGNGFTTTERQFFVKLQYLFRS